MMKALPHPPLSWERGVNKTSEKDVNIGGCRETAPDDYTKTL